MTVSPLSLDAPRRTSLTAVLALLLLAATVVAVPVVPSTTRPSGPATTVAPIADVDPAVVATLVDARTADVIVQATPGVVGVAADTVRATGGRVTRHLPIVDGFAATITAETLDALRSLRGIVAVSLDGPVQLAGGDVGGDGDSIYVQAVQAHRLHRDGYDGSGVGIAVIDSGVSEIADLAGRIVGAVDLSGEGDDVDAYGHGTFVAGIAAGDGTRSNGRHAGVAPGAHIIPVKIAGADGSSDVSHVLAAFQYVVSFKDTYDIGVVNLSLGTNSHQPYRLSPMNYAVERAWDAGIVVVVSAGNHGELGPGHIPKPADDPLVITVGATDTRQTRPVTDDTIAPFSSIGPSMADGIQKPDIVAPGTSLVGPLAPGSTVAVANPGSVVDTHYLRGSGTSFAAGVVSGAVALLRQAHPGWTPDQIKGAITAAAHAGPVGDPNVDGAGLLDIGAAADLVSPPLANQGVDRSTGLGSLALDRGDLAIDLTLDATLGTTTRLDLNVGVTAQNLPFDPLAYTTTEWTNSSWYNSSWYNSSWYNSSWYNSSWYNSSWYNSSWYSATWD